MTNQAGPDQAVPPSPQAGVLQRIYAFLVSPRLALALLVLVLAGCVLGVTVVRGERAYQLIFGTIWFNALLILLAVSSAAAFFSRTWKRRLTLVSVGMIFFHLSFAAMLGGIVYNSLFQFRAVLRITEGETLQNGELQSYDDAQAGRLFDPSRLRGETTLVKAHRGFKVDGQEKEIAYEVEVGEPGSKRSAIIYATQSLVRDGVRYFRSKEGYSILLILYDREGRELYGLHVPLQSLVQGDGSHLYTTGSAHGPSAIPFPQPPEEPRAEVAMAFRPNTVADRTGEVTFRVAPPGSLKESDADRTGTVTIGERFDAGEFFLVPREVRYWVGIEVRYDPGLTVILSSLCFGLGGMVLTFVGRMRRGVKRRAA